MLFKKIKNSFPTINAASGLVRAGGRSIWGLALPAIMSVTNFGTYSLLQTTASILAQISILGATQTLIREPQKAQPLLGLFLHSLFLLTFSALVTYQLLPGETAGFYILLFALSVSLMVYLILSARSKAKLLFPNVLWAEGVGTVVLLMGLAILVIAWYGNKEVNYSMVLPFEILSVLIVVVVLISKTRFTSPELKMAGTFSMLRSVYSVGFLVLFDIAIWRRIEIYFLQKSFEGLTGVAVFSLASQIAFLFMILPGSILEAWLPSFAEFFHKNQNEYRDLVRARFRKYAAFYLVFLISVSVLGFLLIKFLFLKYLQWMPYIVAIILIRVASGFFWFYSTVLYATKNERALFLPVITSAVVSLAANGIFTLHYGLDGLLVAYALTQLFVSVGTLWAYQKKAPGKYP